MSLGVMILKQELSQMFRFLSKRTIEENSLIWYNNIDFLNRVFKPSKGRDVCPKGKKHGQDRI